ncbi:translesion DNA synthesis-associated protein ImuA [Aliiglaciecola sp. CAU 1673]|uniref:translesion DNA synthesis-associated protein ImuA n=1 Tax=Aliiglaciecola sp. CAU 1673 TaxID=3032595 RepID=UPI0023DACC72|nr:translesion DNA synthesis-associated protein ImuA [Aliiglaciecola sp. CAU 1673]MDF2179297.1 translesion DNA synthesis-associated protein ImuA [Aliiglaciecola sp. CAU 1673]
MNPILDHLKNKGWLWQAEFRRTASQVPPTGGFEALDHHLPGGLAAYPVVEIHSPPGIGELRLLLPGLAAQSRQDNRLVAWIAPPHKLNAESLHHAGLPLFRMLIIQPQDPKQALWAAEQCLGSGACQSVLLWHGDLEVAQLKRLQQAGKQGQAQLFLFRTRQSLSLSLPVPLSLTLSAHATGLSIRVNKCRGSWPPPPFELDLRKRWPYLCLQQAPLPQDHGKVIPFHRAS